tara:strand:+ start:3660 stop:3974 length:315 start_codon:yes stop_codon:yes gene_type:complete
MGTDISKRSAGLRRGDLVVYKDSKDVGILVQKHKVLRTGSPNVPIERWYYAWRIKWNRELPIEPKYEWKKNLESSLDEKKLLRDIKEGRIDHYSASGVKKQPCN